MATVRTVRLPIDQTIQVGHVAGELFVDLTARENGRATPDHDVLVMSIPQAIRLIEELQRGVAFVKAGAASTPIADRRWYGRGERGLSHSDYMASHGMTCEPGCDLCRSEKMRR